MITSIALWLAQELLKFLAGRLFGKQLQAIFDLIDKRMKPGGSRYVDACFSVAVRSVTGALPGPVQMAVLKLLYDPAQAANK